MRVRAPHFRTRDYVDIRYDHAVKKRRGSATGIVAGVGLLGLVALSLGTPDACAVSSNEVIGAEGGTVRSADGLFTLEIPEGALEDDVEVSVHAVDCEQEGEAGCYEVRPQGVVFTEPAEVIYEAAELMSMESVSISVQGADGFAPLADAEVDREEEILSASVLYLSRFSVQAR